VGRNRILKEKEGQKGYLQNNYIRHPCGHAVSLISRDGQDLKSNLYSRRETKELTEASVETSISTPLWGVIRVVKLGVIPLKRGATPTRVKRTLQSENKGGTTWAQPISVSRGGHRLKSLRDQRVGKEKKTDKRVEAKRERGFMAGGTPA